MNFLIANSSLYAAHIRQSFLIGDGKSREKVIVDQFPENVEIGDDNLRMSVEIQSIGIVMDPERLRTQFRWRVVLLFCQVGRDKSNVCIGYMPSMKSKSYLSVAVNPLFSKPTFD